MSLGKEDALINLITPPYERLRECEIDQHIIIGNHDARPRVEYFHDAVRAALSGDDPKRLQVEALAHDVGVLRTLQHNPFAREHTYRQQSPTTRLTTHTDAATTNPATVRSELTELYRQYTLLFVALLADIADDNYRARIDQKNIEVEEIAALLHEIEVLTTDSIHFAALVKQHIYDARLSTKILAPLGKKAQRMARMDAITYLKGLIPKTDNEIASIENAHFHFVTGQLSVYEHSKEIVHQLAGRGLNVAGKFLASAIQKGMQRGRGGPGM